VPVTGRRPVVAILPSRDEPDTIAALPRAVDLALDDDHALIVHADASMSPATTTAFRGVATRARTVCLRGLPLGKGTQIRHALTHLDEHGAVLLADTDTRNPDPATYRALLDTLASGAAIALAEYQRYCDEANLTHWVARPLIAAATGHDVPQPLAGDIALAATVAHAVPARYTALPAALAARVDGYGIDAFLLHTAACFGRPVSVRLATTKQHAPSFPHLPAIFAQAVPVLLHPATTTTAAAPTVGEFRLTDRRMPDQQRDQMLARLQALRPAESRYDRSPWPRALATAWQAVAGGIPATTVTRWLWPAYLDRVHTWLADGGSSDLAARAATLRAAARDVLTALTTTGKATS
jgi:glucosylglycerate synthase